MDKDQRKAFVMIGCFALVLVERAPGGGIRGRDYHGGRAETGGYQARGVALSFGASSRAASTEEGEL